MKYLIYFIFITSTTSLFASMNTYKYRDYWASEFSKTRSTAVGIYSALSSLYPSVGFALSGVAGDLESEMERVGASVLFIDRNKEGLASGVLNYDYTFLNKNQIKGDEQQLGLSMSSSNNSSMMFSLGVHWETQKYETERKAQQFLGKVNLIWFNENAMISVLHHFDLYHEGFNGLAETLEESTHLNFSYEWKKIELMFFLKTLFGQPDPEKSLLFGIGTNIVISDHLLFAMDLSYQNDQENFLSQVKIDWFVKSLFFSYSFRKNGKSNYTMHNIDLRYPF